MKQNKLYKALPLLVLVCSTMISGCTLLGSNKLTPTEVATVQRIYVADELGNEIEHLSIINSVIDNDKFTITAPKIYEEFKSNFILELIGRGYQIADSLTDSDFGITLSTFKTENYPFIYGVDGAGFFVDGRPFVNELRPKRRWQPGVVAQVAITAKLVDPMTSKTRTYSSTEVKNPTGLRTVAGSWSGYSAKEQEFLLKKLADTFISVPSQLLNGLNLVKK